MRTPTSVRFVTPLALALALAAAPVTADVVIPSSAFVQRCRNVAEFQTDVRVFNPTSSPVNVTPVFYDQRDRPDASRRRSRIVTVPARGQVAFDNILATLFGRPTTAPSGRSASRRRRTIIVSSCVNNVNACGNGLGTSGQWLPGIDVGQAP